MFSEKLNVRPREYHIPFFHTFTKFLFINNSSYEEIFVCFNSLSLSKLFCIMLQ